MSSPTGTPRSARIVGATSSPDGRSRVAPRTASAPETTRMPSGASVWLPPAAPRSSCRRGGIRARARGGGSPAAARAVLRRPVSRAHLQRILGEREVAEADRLVEAGGERRRVGGRACEQGRLRVEVAPQLLGDPARLLGPGAGREGRSEERRVGKRGRSRRGT